MEKEIIYKEHIDTMFGNQKIENFSDEEVIFILKRLISCLPNEGKLYKYRPIEGEIFDNAYDSLVNGYIWLSAAENFNDDEDCTLLYDLKSVSSDIESYINSHIDLIVKYLINHTNFANINGGEYIKGILKCVDKSTGHIKKKKASSYLTKYGMDISSATKIIDDVQKWVNESIKEHSPVIKKIVDNFVNFNKLNRAKGFICSFSGSYNANTMWANYAGNNKGFCIEYDFEKSLSLPTQIQRLIISLYKVIYNDVKAPLSFINILNYILSGQQETEEFKKCSFELLTQLITKKTEWQYENEWRIFLYNVEHKLNADLVNRIIIDERIIDNENTNKLISLAKERGWAITIRSKNIMQTEHEFYSYSG